MKCLPIFQLVFATAVLSAVASRAVAQSPIPPTEANSVTAAEAIPALGTIAVLGEGAIAYVTPGSGLPFPLQAFPDAAGISAAYASSPTELLLFNGAQYRVFDTQAGIMSPDWTAWPGLPAQWANNLTAATAWDASSVLLINQTDYVVYDFSSQQYTASGNITEWPGWPHTGPTQVRAAYNATPGRLTLLTTRGELTYDQFAGAFAIAPSADGQTVAVLLPPTVPPTASPAASPAASPTAPTLMLVRGRLAGGGQGSAVGQPLDEGERVEAVNVYTTRVWGEMVVCGVQLVTASAKTGRDVLGKASSSKRTFGLKPGETITGFSGSYGESDDGAIDVLTVTTSTRSLGPVGNTGARGGTRFAERLPNGAEFAGFAGLATDKLSSLGLHYRVDAATREAEARAAEAAREAEAWRQAQANASAAPSGNTPNATQVATNAPYQTSGTTPSPSVDDVMAISTGMPPEGMMGGGGATASSADNTGAYVPVDEYLDDYDDFTESASGNMTSFMVQPLSGIDWLGAGFDVLYYDPLRPNDLRARKSFRSVLVTSSSARAGNNNQYLKPYGSFFGSSNSGERSEESKWVHSYRDFSTTFGISASGTVPLKKVMGSLSASYKEMNNTRIGSESLYMFKQIKRKIHEVDLQLNWIDNALDQKYKQKLDRQFVRDVAALPVPTGSFSRGDISAEGQELPGGLARVRGQYRRFINKYGTHFARKVTYGGQYVERYEVRRSDYEKTRGTEMSFKAGVEAKTGGGGKAPGGELGVTQSETETIGEKNKNTRRKVFVQGGNGEDDLPMWRSKVDENMAPVDIDFQLMAEVLNPIMFPNDGDIEAKSIALEVITNHYILNEAPEPVEGAGDFFRDLPPLQAPATITVKNKGGYVMWYTVKYNLNGTWHEEESGNFPLAQSEDIRIPVGATNIVVTATQTTGEIFSTEVATVQDKCYKCWGTIFSTGWSECDD